ncbi:MAG: hypothetical protein LBM73_02635 [Candidatus Nomurabacteria bacterium]|jgi:hypothetical protein|nr:hypothetical protein [Candidatus Nomurabacteria bacterium]
MASKFSANLFLGAVRHLVKASDDELAVATRELENRHRVWHSVHGDGAGDDEHTSMILSLVAIDTVVANRNQTQPVPVDKPHIGLVATNDPKQIIKILTDLGLA